MMDFGTMAERQQAIWAAGDFARIGSLIGDIFQATGAHVPPPSGLRPATEWGTEDRLRELFGDRIGSLRIRPRQFVFRFPSVDYMLEYYRSWYGPTKMSFDGLDEDGRDRLAADLLDVYQKHNRAADGSLAAPSDYLEIVATVV